MLKEKMPEPDEPSSMKPPKSQNNGNGGLLNTIKKAIFKHKNGGETLRDVIEEYIEETANEDKELPSVAQHEKSLITNVLKLREKTVIDVMIPRADIAAIDINDSQESLMALLSEKQFSRIPVYRETLDDVVGTVHIKDILSFLATNMPINIKEMVRPIPIVSPSLPVLDLLLKMQQERKHMVMVVDEHGGIDGLITIGDLIEAIVGEFDDEFDEESTPQITTKPDGSLIVDARIEIDEFEETVGLFLTDEEREEVDTLGGLVFFIASRIPARGEVIKHESGMIFEVIDADQRRVQSLKVRNLP